MRRTLRWALAIYALLIPLPSNIYLSTSARLWVQNNRPYLFVGLLALMGSTAIGRRVKSKSHRVAFIFAMVFPCYLAIVTVLHDKSWQTLMLFTTWSVGAFYLAPRVIRTNDDVQAVARILIGANAVILLVSWFLARGGVPIGLPRSPTLGYLNENYFGQVVQVIILSLLILTAARRDARQRPLKHRRLIVLGCVGATVWLAIVGARGVALALFVTGVAWLFATHRRRSFVPIFVPFILIAFVWGSLLYASTPNISSGRFRGWSESVQSLNVGDPVINWLFGPPALTSSDAVPIYNPLAEQSQFITLRADNTYLEVALQAGIVGVILFLVPYLYVLTRRKLTYVAKAVWAVMVGVGVQSLTTATIPAIGAPLAFLIMFVVAVPLQMRRMAKPSPLAAPNPPRLKRAV